MTQIEWFVSGESHRCVVSDCELDSMVAHLRSHGATLVRLREYDAERREAFGIAWMA